jgi:hypothetical protein
MPKEIRAGSVYELMVMNIIRKPWENCDAKPFVTISQQRHHVAIDIFIADASQNRLTMWSFLDKG